MVGMGENRGILRVNVQRATSVVCSVSVNLCGL